MDWEIASARAERAADVAAAAAFAAATGFALWALAAERGFAIVVAVPAFATVYAMLRRLPADEPTYALPGFDLPAFAPAPESEADELLLDDALGGIEPDARVVRLFGPGQAFGGNPAESPDASEALSEALAELRRALR